MLELGFRRFVLTVKKVGVQRFASKLKVVLESMDSTYEVCPDLTLLDLPSNLNLRFITRTYFFLLHTVGTVFRFLGGEKCHF